MSTDGTGKIHNKTGRLAKVFTPFILLVIAAFFANFLFERYVNSTSSNPTASPPTREVSKPITPETEVVDEEQSQLPVATAIAYETVEPIETPTAAPTLLPTIQPDAVASLSGPPAESRFRLNSPVAFYWQPAQPLEEGRVYALFLTGDTGEQKISMIDEPNLGAGYQTHFIAEDFELPEGTYQWQVRIFDQETERDLGTTAQRTISFIDGAE